MFQQTSSGSLRNTKDKFNLNSKYNPQSFIHAASSDFFVRSFGNTYGVNYVITNCSNNYGPYQYVGEINSSYNIKLYQKKKIPIYGRGKNIREWIFVKDHCEALIKILFKKKQRKTI